MAEGLAQEQLKKMGKASSQMSALEVAALGKNLASIQLAGETGEPMVTALEMDAEDEDWKPLIEGAKEKAKEQEKLGVFGRKVDFTLHEARFLGRVGYSVKGGVVPLFDGAAIDLKFSNLQSKKTKDASADPVLGDPSGYENWVEGEGGMLVLAPVGMDNVVPVPMQHVTVTEKAMSGVAEKHIEFKSGDLKLTAEKLTIEDDKIKLSSVSKTKSGEAAPRDNLEAEITGTGINVTDRDELPETPIFQKSTLKDKIEKKVGEKVEELLNGGGGDDDDDEKKKSFKEELISDVKETATTFAKTAALGKKEEEESKVEFKHKENIKEGSFALLAQKKEEEDDPTLVKEVATNAATEAGKVVHDAVTDGAKTFWENKKNPKEAAKEALKSAKEPFKEKYEQGKEIVEGFKSEEVKNGFEKLKDTAKDVWNGNAEEEDVKKALEEAVPLAALKKFLGMDEDDTSDEASSEEEEDDKSDTITLATIPLLPLVNFDVSLTPDISFQPYVKAEVKNLWNLLKKNKDSDKVDLEFEAGIKSSLSLAAKAGFTEGIPYLFQGFEGVVATAAMEGNVEPLEGAMLSQDGVALRGIASVSVQRGKNGALKQAGDASVAINGGFRLKGKVGAEVSLSSKLFSWNKTLVEKTFAEWELLQIALNLGLTKTPAGGILEGWKVNEANVAMKRDRGMGKAFVEKNTEERKYGLTTPDTKESEEYKNLQTDFRAALNLVKRFATPPANEVLLIPTGQDDSGYADTMENLHNLIVTFGGLWASSQRELEQVNAQLEAYMASKTTIQNEKKLRDAVDLHNKNQEAMKNWKAGMKDKKGKDISAMSYYKSLKTNSEDKFEEYLEKKAKNAVYTFETIAKYEKGRYEEATKENRERIVLLKKSIEENKSDEEIIKAYKKAGGKKVFDKKAQFQSKETLIAFEKQKKQESQKEAREHLVSVMGITSGKDIKKAREKAYAKEKKKSEAERQAAADEAERIAFFQKYAKTLNVDKHRDILYRFGDRELLMSYERNCMKDKTGDFLEQYESGKGMEQREEKQQKEIKKEFYKTATIDEMIEFETLKNKGKEGKLLDEYLSTGKTTQEDGELLERIFGTNFLKGKSSALRKFTKRLEKRSVDENIKYITIDMLFDYAIKRQKKAKTIEGRKKISQEIQYLAQSRVILDAAPPEKADEVQAKEVKAYFNRFKDAGTQYQKDLQSGKEVNLELMQAALAEDTENERMKILLDGKEKGKTDTEVLEAYLAAKGADAKKLSEFLMKKHTGANNKLIVDSDRLKRFYRVQMRKKNKKHFERYMKLEELYKDGTGADYRTMLLEYGKLGGGEGYAKQILSYLEKDGMVNGRKISIEEAFGYESANVEAVGKKHQDRLDTIDKRAAQGVDDKDIIAEYEEKNKEDWGYVKSKLADLGADWKSDFEKSLKDVALSPAQILEYEIESRDKAGEKHANRLKALYGMEDTEKLPEDLSTLKLPPKEKMEEQRQAYMEEAKRFEKEDSLKDAVKEELERMKGSDTLNEEIIFYEQSEAERSEAELNEHLKVHQDMIDRRDMLQREETLSRELAYNISDLKINPQAIFSRISEFEEAVNWTEEMEKKKETLEQENQALIETAELESADKQKDLSEASGK